MQGLIYSSMQDSLSYFEINLPFYFQRNGWEKTLRRSLWGYARLSPETREYLRDISYPESIFNKLLGKFCLRA